MAGDNNFLDSTDEKILDEYFVSDMEFAGDNIIILAKPREQYFYNTNEYNQNN